MDIYILSDIFYKSLNKTCQYLYYLNCLTQVTLFSIHCYLFDWNSWATAAKASELGNCGTVGTEFVVACGSSEETLTGGGGEPKNEKVIKA